MSEIHPLLKTLLESGQQSDSHDTLDSVPGYTASLLTSSSSAVSLLTDATTTTSISDDISSSIAVDGCDVAKNDSSRIIHEEIEQDDIRSATPTPSLEKQNYSFVSERTPTSSILSHHHDSQNDARLEKEASSFSSIILNDNSKVSFDKTRTATPIQQEPTLSSKTHKKQLRFAETPSETRDHLRHKLSLLQLSNKELIMASDARAHTYEVKIKGLNSIIVNLENENMDLKETIAVKEKEIEMLKESRRALLNANDDADINQETKRQLETHIDSPVNLDLLHQNNQLRESVGKLERKLAEMNKMYLNYQRSDSMISKGPVDIDVTLPPLVQPNENYNESLPAMSSNRIIQEVDRILSTARPQDTSSWNTSSFLVTDTTTDMIQETLSRLEREKSELTTTILELQNQLVTQTSTLSQEKGKNMELQNTLDAVHSELTDLENNFTALQAETDIIRASDRLSRQKVEEQKEMIADYSQQIIQLNEQMQVMQSHMEILRQEHEQYKHAQSVLNSMNRLQVHQLQSTLRESETLRADALEQLRLPISEDGQGPESSKIHTNHKMDPISMLEAHWKADRQHLVLEIDLLKGALQGKELELERIKTEYEEKMLLLHDENEWALLTAKCTVAENDAKQFEEQVTAQTGVIQMLQSKVETMESEIEKVKAEKSRLKEKLNKLTREVEGHERVSKELRNTRENFEKQVNALEIKNKNLSCSVSNKERLVKELKAQIALLERGNVRAGDEKEIIVTIQDSIKNCKQELMRKNALLKHWKEKVATMKSEIEYLRTSEQNQVDPHVVTTLQKHVRQSHQQIKVLEARVEEFEAREVQLQRAIQRIFESIYEHYLVEKSKNESDAHFTEAFTQFSASMMTTSSSNDGTLVHIDPNDVNATAQELAKSILDIDFHTIFQVPKAKPKDVFERLSDILASKKDLESNLHSYFREFLPIQTQEFKN